MFKSDVNVGEGPSWRRVAVDTLIGTLVVALAAAVAGVVYFNQRVTDQSAYDAALLNVAGRERMLVQRAEKLLERLQANVLAGRLTDKTAVDLAEAASVFGSDLRATIQGGKVDDPGGASIMLAPLDDQRALGIARQGLATWSGLDERIQAIGNPFNPDRAAVARAGAYGAINDATLTESMDDLAAALQDVARKREAALALPRNALIAAAAACFFAIILLLFARIRANRRRISLYARQLERQNTELAERNRELDETRQVGLIMDTVSQGLLLVGPDGRIGTQYSRVLHDLLETQALAGRDLLTVLRPIFDERTYRATEKFLRLVFDATRKERQVLKVNPLLDVEANFPQASGGYATKYLSFSFRRIGPPARVTQVFVAISDVTERVTLERELRASEEKKNRQFEMLIGVLHVEPQALETFIHTARENVARMSEALRAEHIAMAGPASMAELRDRLNVVFASAHAIKGVAGMLRLDHFRQRASALEDKLVDLRRKPTIGGDDFLSIVIAQSDLRGDLDELADVRAKLAGIARHPAAPDGRSGLISSLEDFAAALALKLGKEVSLHVDGVDPSGLTMERRTVVQDVLVQLLRNSLAHGVEDPPARAAAGKPRIATITIAANPEAPPGSFGFVFRDDGRGLDPARIRDTAVRSGILSSADAANIDDVTAASLIFEPGFTTSDNANDDAGRGIGMELVRRHIIDEAGGEIVVRSDPGHYAEFAFVLPG